MEEKAKDFELVCQNFGLVKKLDTVLHPCREERGWLPVVILRNDFHKTLEKHGIFNAVNTRALSGGRECCEARWEFLGNVIHEFANFPEPNNRAVNYVCFFHDYFEVVPEEVWPRKKEILRRISPAFSKIQPKTQQKAKERFDRW